jgi:hypothetical protein
MPSSGPSRSRWWGPRTAATPWARWSCATFSGVASTARSCRSARSTRPSRVYWHTPRSRACPPRPTWRWSAHPSRRCRLSSPSSASWVLARPSSSRQVCLVSRARAMETCSRRCWQPRSRIACGSSAPTPWVFWCRRSASTPASPTWRRFPAGSPWCPNRARSAPRCSTGRVRAESVSRISSPSGRVPTSTWGMCSTT